MKHFPSILPVTIASFLLAATQLSGAGITISLTTVTAAVGSTADSFEVDLTNMGSSAVTVGGFSFELDISNPNISLINATTSTTASYIFAGDSTFGPDIATSSTGQIIDASDIDSVFMAGTTIDPGVTFGLGSILFNVSSSATPGATVVNISPFPNTTLSDATGKDLSIGGAFPGQITIPGGTAPEPSTFLLLSLVAVPLLCLRSRQTLLLADRAVSLNTQRDYTWKRWFGLVPQTVKSQSSANGELTHGTGSTEIHERV